MELHDTAGIRDACAGVDDLDRVGARVRHRNTVEIKELHGVAKVAQEAPRGPPGGPFG